MDDAPLLDTHAWVWWTGRAERLHAQEVAALDALPVDERPYLCDISLWEVATLVMRDRLSLTSPLDEWLGHAAHPRSVRILSITPEIAAEIARLPSTLHRDPADRIIVATCRVMNLPLLTRDRRILRSRLVRRWRPLRLERRSGPHAPRSG
ncbi:MAG: type II toxin-antitoxin system VapC family toxin [Acidobacteria bacterium]|nr:type II toxin-antitoxin system VapC family toxin [Acidobacteriota bacterium]